MKIWFCNNCQFEFSVDCPYICGGDRALDIINLCPHPIILDLGYKKFEFPPEGLARLKTTVLPYFSFFTKTLFGDVEGLPNKKYGTYYIVSQLIKSAYPDRTDLCVPAGVKRDEAGNIISCTSLGL